jgi:tetrahydromethanopterin S-methyltransferase subunit D
MIFKSLQRSPDARENSSAGVIVLLMMALVFVPIIGAHAAMIWHNELALGTGRLAAIVNLVLPVF